MFWKDALYLFWYNRQVSCTCNRRCPIFMKDGYNTAFRHTHPDTLIPLKHTLTFDPVALVEAYFAFSLGRVWSGGHKDSPWDGAVEASALTCGLSSCGGCGRPGRASADGRLKLKAPWTNSIQLWWSPLTPVFYSACSGPPCPQSSPGMGNVSVPLWDCWSSAGSLYA